MSNQDVFAQLKDLGVLSAPKPPPQEFEPDAIEEEEETSFAPDLMLEVVDATIGRLDGIASELADLRVSLVELRKDLGIARVPPPRSAPEPRRARPARAPRTNGSPHPAPSQRLLAQPGNAAEAVILREISGPATEAPAADPQMGDYLGMGALESDEEVEHAVPQEG